jgi:LacI family transcriptional regulator
VSATIGATEGLIDPQRRFSGLRRLWGDAHYARVRAARIAVVGVGDHEHADFFDPPLTCVGPSNETIVEQIVMQLFDLMNRRRVKPVETFVPPSVVMRASA